MPVKHKFPTVISVERERRGGVIGVAVNVLDLDRVLPEVRAMLLGGKLDLKGGAIRTDPARLDEAAVAFACPLLEAAGICDVLRGHDRRAGDPPTRVYLKRKAWTRVSGGVTLTLVQDGRCILNPELFGEDGAELLPPEAETVDF